MDTPSNKGLDLRREKGIIIQSNSPDDIPENAIQVPPRNAASYRLRQMYSWRPKMDMWAVRYGPWILGAFAVAPSLLITQYFRRKLKLRSKGYYSMYTALTFAPIFMATGIHYEVITMSLATFNAKYCPMCYEMKAAVIQASLSTIYPAFLSGFSGLMYAARHGTMDLPHYKDYKGVIMHYVKLTKPLLPKLSIIAVFEVVLGHFITYMEAKQMFTYHEKVMKQHLEKLKA